jgi:hypothetical protein
MFEDNPLKIIKEAAAGSIFIYVESYQGKTFSDRINEMLQWIKYKKDAFDIIYTGTLPYGAKVFIYKKLI